MTDQIHATYRPHPFRNERTTRTFAPGSTLADVIAAVGFVNPTVEIDGCGVPPALWSKTYPKTGTAVVVRERPDGLLESVGAFVYFVLGFEGFTGAVVTYAITGTIYAATAYGLSLAVNSLAQSLLPDADRDPLAGGTTSPSLRGAGNELRPGAPFPELLGRLRFFPPLGGQPFTEIVGSDTYVRALYVLSKGEIEVLDAGADILLGELPISEMQGTMYQLRTGAPGDDPIELYTRQAEQQNVSIGFETVPSNTNAVTGEWQTLRTSGEVDELAVEIQHPALFRVNESGSNRTYRFRIDLEYRKVGEMDWLVAVDADAFSGATNRGAVIGDQIEFSGHITSPFLSGFSWRVPETGQYDVRMRRIETEPSNNRPGGGDVSVVVADFTWRALKGFADGLPILPSAEGVATLAVRIRLDDQSGGFIQALSVKATRMLPVYDPGNLLGLGIDANGWTVANAATRNPAAAFRHVWKGMLRTPVAESVLDYDAIGAFFDNCETDGYRFDQYIDFESPATQLAGQIAGAGFGSFEVGRGGKIGVVEDRAKANVVQAITAHNSRGLSLTRTYPDPVHAVRVTFQNEDEGYEPNSEIIVYDDGYSEDGSEGTQVATELVSIALSGVVEPAAAYRHGRRLLATGRLRPRRYVVEMDLEKHVARRGDRVKLNHRSALLGEGSGRVRDLARATLDTADNDADWAGRSSNTISEENEGALFFLKSVASGVTTQLGFTYDPAGTFTLTGRLFAFKIRLSQAAWDQLDFDSGVVVALDDGGDADEFALGTLQIPSPDAWHQIVIDPHHDTPLVEEGIDYSAVDLVGVWVAGSFDLDDGAEISIDLVQTMFPTVLVLDEPVTFEWDKSYVLQLRVIDPAAPDRYTLVEAAVTNQLDPHDDPLATTTVVLSAAPTPYPRPGDLFMFGRTALVSLDALVAAVNESSANYATVELVDYAPAIFTADAEIPVFTPGTSSPVPIGFRGPSQPIIVEIVTDERALAVSRTGTLTPTARILISGQHDPGRPTTEFYQVQTRRSLIVDENGDFVDIEEPWESRPVEVVNATTIVVKEIDEGTYYDFRVRGVATNGATSRWATLADVLVSGKTNPPPDVSNVRIENGNLWWDLPFEPLDLAGFRVRLAEGANTQWNDGAPLSPNDVPGPPLPISHIPGGTKTFMVRAIDTSRNLSVGMGFVTRDLGDPLVENVLRTQDEHAAGFLGPKNQTELDAGDLVTSGESDAFWTDPSAPFWSDDRGDPFWGESTYYEGTYLASFEVVAEDLPGALLTEIESASGYRAESRRVYRYDDAEATTGWSQAGFGGAPSVDATNFREGAGSVRVTTASELPNYLLRSLSPAVDIRGLWVEFYVRLHADTIDEENGFWVRLTDVDAVSAVFQLGTNNLTALGDDWYLVRFRPSTVEPDAIDYATLASIRLESNVVSGLTSSSCFINVDRLAIAGDWAAWPGRLADPVVGFYDLRLTLFGGNVEGRISAFDISVDAPDIYEYLDSYTLPSAAPNRLPITRTFRAITNVSLTLEDNGVGARTVLIIDKGIGGPPLTDGPEIEILSSAGANVAGRVDAVLQGY